MIKKTVKYEDFNGDMQEEELYFNITKTEATEMSVSERGGLDKVLIKIRDAKDEKEIYKHLFWEAHNMDSIANIGFPKTAMTLMDSGVNIGPYRANRYLQLVLGVQLTGSIDERTLSTLRETELTDEQIASRLLQRRSNFYARLVARDSVYQKYHRGWNNRVNDMRELVEAI